MKAYIVTDSTHYIPRADIVGACLLKKGYEVEYVITDFNHALKKKLREDKPGYTYIDAGSYKKNISPKRLLYHHVFAKKAYAYLKDCSISLLYVFIPGNSLAPAACSLKEEKGCRLIFDVIDLWPESLPVKGVGWTAPVRYWKRLRDAHIGKADTIITECGLYIKRLGLVGGKIHTLYWMKPVDVPPPEPGEGAAGSCHGTFCNTVRIAYIGAINNIIDIPAIKDILAELMKGGGVELDIIGEGENRKRFLKELESAGIPYTYHGTVYDEAAKEKILRKCTWGLNIMKPGLSVGLTMKSIEYMANGLRLINSIRGDTWEMTEKFSLGVNISDNPAETAARIRGFDGADAGMIYDFYKSRFTPGAAERLFDEVL